MTYLLILVSFLDGWVPPSPSYGVAGLPQAFFAELQDLLKKVVFFVIGVNINGFGLFFKT